MIFAAYRSECRDQCKHVAPVLSVSNSSSPCVELRYSDTFCVCEAIDALRLIWLRKVILT